ncbi:MAG: NUDIX hydrolase [Gemmataceae bacterium]
MSETPKTQAGVVPLRNGKVCLITSRKTGYWIVPKGMIDPGFTAEEAALQEAFEEAGLKGTIEGDVVGSYRYEKWEREYQVLLYVMRVTEVHDEWEESNQRERYWASFAEAREMIRDNTLRKLVLSVMQ